MPAPEVAPLDLNDLIGEVLGLYENSNAEVAVSLASDLPLVLGDATQMRQIIHNLLRNAEDAQENRELAHIQISTRRLGDHAELCIADSGPGFPPEIMARVFEPYVTSKAKGTGLGLAIVKKIVDEHHGTIDITNRQQGGAQVSIALPLSPWQPELTKAANGTNTGR
jgi:nitrogen fixation/metabolism regulation signal transduction histidine kinase